MRARRVTQEFYSAQVRPHTCAAQPRSHVFAFFDSRFETKRRMNALHELYYVSLIYTSFDAAWWRQSCLNYFIINWCVEISLFSEI